MLLRRVIEHVRDQNWTAVAIDFVIVVIGVFIGIQVSNWNASRADDARSQHYMLRLQDDLQSDVTRLEDRLSFWNQVLDYGRRGLAFAETGAATDNDRWPYILAFFQASQVAEFQVKDTTFSELKSAGELALISDPELRSTVADYYHKVENPILTERPRYREMVRSRIPLQIQNYIWEKCWSNSEIDPLAQVLIDCPAPAGIRFDGLAEEIAGDPELMAALTYWLSTLKIALVINESARTVALELLETMQHQTRREAPVTDAGKNDQS
jgi:hypothetical protein